MKAYTIFDDFPQQSIDLLRSHGIDVTILPHGEERPTGHKLQSLLHEYDILFISTAQKMPEEMFDDISSPKIIATASSGVDHIHVPEAKRHLVSVANATHANRRTVTEHTFGLILTLRKQLLEGRLTAAAGNSKKTMKGKLHDLYGSTMGVIGAGGIASTVLRMAQCFGMRCLCWTFNPDKHDDLKADGVVFTDIDTLLKESDVVSVNIPMSESTRQLIDAHRVSLLKDSAVFITTSRAEITDCAALFDKAAHCPTFGLGMDLDVKGIETLWSPEMNNVIVTPHIAGGTVESRIRLFNECCENAIRCAGAKD